ncbi:TraB/GumN family protein [Rubripirellula amarantea]|nr:TraB/GumN family protein [Rubripirellula amarantea]
MTKPFTRLAQFATSTYGICAVAASVWLAAAVVRAEPAVAEAPAKKVDAKDADTSVEDEPGTEWVRLKKDKRGRPVAMQTAIVRYRSTPENGEAPVEVDLVGAVHVGDAAYYADLNKRFEQYDALLYELVAPEGTRIEAGTKASNRHALGAMQNGMKNMLALEHQLEKVDYTKPNFVHADMSPDEFFQSMASKDESFLKMYFRMMGQSIAQQSQMQANGATPDVDMMRALFAKDRPRQLKIAMAGQLAEMESLLIAFGGEEGSTLITERNKAALKVLRQQLDAGKTKLGVFYGAGHLADMHDRLKADFGLSPVDVTWLTAWDLAASSE